MQSFAMVGASPPLVLFFIGKTFGCSKSTEFVYADSSPGNQVT